MWFSPPQVIPHALLLQLNANSYLGGGAYVQLRIFSFGQWNLQCQFLMPEMFFCLRCCIVPVQMRRVHWTMYLSSLSDKQAAAIEFSWRILPHCKWQAVGKEEIILCSRREIWELHFSCHFPNNPWPSGPDPLLSQPGRQNWTCLSLKRSVGGILWKYLGQSSVLCERLQCSFSYDTFSGFSWKNWWIPLNACQRLSLPPCGRTRRYRGKEEPPGEVDCPETLTQV